MMNEPSLFDALKPSRGPLCHWDDPPANRLAARRLSEWKAEGRVHRGNMKDYSVMGNPCHQWWIVN